MGRQSDDFIKSFPIKIGESGMMASQLKRNDSEDSVTLLLSDEECNSACSFLSDSDVKKDALSTRSYREECHFTAL